MTEESSGAAAARIREQVRMTVQGKIQSDRGAQILGGHPERQQAYFYQLCVEEIEHLRLSEGAEPGDMAFKEAIHDFAKQRDAYLAQDAERPDRETAVKRATETVEQAFSLGTQTRQSSGDPASDLERRAAIAGDCRVQTYSVSMRMAYDYLERHYHEMARRTRLNARGGNCR